MLLDDLIGIFSPGRALHRKRARIALSALRTYEGAKQGRRTDGWFARGTSANAEIASAGHRLRDRASDVVRNNPYGKKAKRTFHLNVVGTGITPRSKAKSPRVRKQITQAWKDWGETLACDADGIFNFYGIENLVARTLYERGEVLVRFRDRRPSDGLALPFQLQVLECDFLDSAKSVNLDGGGYILQGVEFDAIGRRVAYWMFPRHPGERLVTGPTLTSRRIPAEEVLHLFDPDRAGQVRGVTEFAASLMKMYDLDNYDEADLVRKQMEACLALVVEQANGIDGTPLGEVKTGANGEIIEGMSPGMIAYTRPGETVKFNNPPASGNYTADLSARLHAIAAGLGVTYEQLTGDLSQVNYSSLRHGLLEFRAWVEYVRWQILIPQLCDRVWRRFIDRAYIAGLIAAQDYSVEWSCPPFKAMDPLKEIEAEEKEVRMMAKTFAQMIADRGLDPEEHVAEIAEWNDKLDSLGIVSDADPRKTARSGAAQSAAADSTATAAKEGSSNATSNPNT